jgi:hypothetical protein
MMAGEGSALHTSRAIDEIIIAKVMIAKDYPLIYEKHDGDRESRRFWAKSCRWFYLG